MFAQLWLDRAISKEDFYWALKEEEDAVSLALSKLKSRFLFTNIRDPEHQQLFRDLEHQLLIIKFYEEMAPSSPGLYFALMPFKGYRDWLHCQFPIMTTELKATVMQDRNIAAPNEREKGLFNQVLDLVMKIYQPE